MSRLDEAYSQNVLGNVRLDWRPRPEFTLGWSLSGNEGWKQVADDIRYVRHPSATGSGNVSRYNDQNRTLGRVGGGSARQESPLWRDIYHPGISTVLDARWKQGAWELTGRAGWSISRYQYYDTEHGFFNSTSVSGLTGLENIPEAGVGFGTANPIPLTLDFEHDYWGPKKSMRGPPVAVTISFEEPGRARAANAGDMVAAPNALVVNRGTVNWPSSTRRRAPRTKAKTRIISRACTRPTTSRRTSCCRRATRRRRGGSTSRMP